MKYLLIITAIYCNSVYCQTVPSMDTLKRFSVDSIPARDINAPSVGEWDAARFLFSSELSFADSTGGMVAGKLVVRYPNVKNVKKVKPKKIHWVRINEKRPVCSLTL